MTSDRDIITDDCVLVLSDSSVIGDCELVVMA